MIENTPRRYTRWPYLVVGVFGMLFVGILYIWSVLKAPLAEEFGWTTAELTINYTLSLCFFCTGSILGGLLSKKIGHRLTLLFAGLIACAGFVFSARLSGESLAMLYLTNGAIGGLGVGASYNAIISTTTAWFPDIQGTCSGALQFGIGASGLLLSAVSEALINALGWRSTFTILGITIGVVYIGVGFALRTPPADAAFPQPKASRNKVEDAEVADYSTGQMLRQPAFWLAFLCVTFIAATGNSVISFCKEFSESVGATAAVATLLVGVLSVCNGVGRFFSGVLFDILGRRNTMLVVNAFAIAAVGFLIFATMTSIVPLCVIGICLAGMSYGGCATGNAAFIAAPFGRKYYSVNFGIATATIMGAALMSSVSGTLITATGGYVQAFLVLLALALVAVLLNLSIRRARRKSAAAG